MAVPDVDVDVTAERCRLRPRQGAARRPAHGADDTLLSRLATPADIAKLPPLTDAQITDMVADYQVESEKVSSVRYIGQLAFRFRADAVSDYLGQGGITTTVDGRSAGPDPAGPDQRRQERALRGRQWLARGLEPAPAGRRGRPPGRAAGRCRRRRRHLGR